MQVGKSPCYRQRHLAECRPIQSICSEVVLQTAVWCVWQNQQVLHTVLYTLSFKITCKRNKSSAYLWEWPTRYTLLPINLFHFNKPVHIDFTNKRTEHKPIHINHQAVPYENTAKYLGMTLDAKLRWKPHVKKNQKELTPKYRKMYWLMGRYSALSVYNKLMLYQQVLKPVWTYGIQLCGCTGQSNGNIIQRFQDRVLRGIVYAPWYILG